MTGPADRFRPHGRGPAFPLANKLERVAWLIVWLLLARATPPQLAGWRRFLLRLFGAMRRRIERGADEAVPVQPAAPVAAVGPRPYDWTTHEPGRGRRGSNNDPRSSD